MNNEMYFYLLVCIQYKIIMLFTIFFYSASAVRLNLIILIHLFHTAFHPFEHTQMSVAYSAFVNLILDFKNTQNTKPLSLKLSANLGFSFVGFLFSVLVLGCVLFLECHKILRPVTKTNAKSANKARPADNFIRIEVKKNYSHYEILNGSVKRGFTHPPRGSKKREPNVEFRSFWPLPKCLSLQCTVLICDCLWLCVCKGHSVLCVFFRGGLAWRRVIWAPYALGLLNKHANYCAIFDYDFSTRGNHRGEQQQ